ncbi:hypothetical protein Tco_0562660, partial [Tanacetum coccineum]
TDIAKIPRKRSKPGKHEHGNRKSTQRAGSFLQKGQKVSSGQLSVNPWSKSQQDKTHLISKSSPQDNNP